MHPAAPKWLRAKLSATLSLLPLRTEGVRQTINFVAASHPAPFTNTEDGNVVKASQGPLLSFEALTQMSKLLSSVPASMPAENYFTELAPQLWDLLDAKDDPEMRKAAAYVIGSGILGKKIYGAPGRIGWILFAEPILKAINPGNKVTNLSAQVLTTQSDLEMALRRLRTIVMSHPNPGLTKRLLQPIVLSLWGLLIYSKRSISSALWTETISELLQAFFRLSARQEHYILVAENMLWDGPERWAYGPGDAGGVLIRATTPEKDTFKMLESLTSVDLAIETYMALLKSSDPESDTIVAIFLSSTRNWLLAGKDSSFKSNRLGEPDEADPFQTFIFAKLAQSILHHCRDKIVEKPLKLLELLEQLLSEHIRDNTIKNHESEVGSSGSSLKFLNIVPNIHSAEIIEESTDVVMIALSLLNTIITSKESVLSPETRMQLQKFLPLLDTLHNRTTKNTSISSASDHIANLIRQPLETHPQLLPSSPKEDEQALYNNALENLSSEQAPIRVEGLATIQELIGLRSSIISTPAITLLFIRNVLTDPDSFVHLAGVRTLVVLAAQDAKLVSRLLADAFMDVNEESGLDGRLAVGETLGCIIQALSGTNDTLKSNSVKSTEWKTGKTKIRCDFASRQSILQIIVSAALAVGGRRGERRKTQRGREQKEAIAAKKVKEANEAWGGEAPLSVAADNTDDSVGFDVSETTDNDLSQKRRVKAKAHAETETETELIQRIAYGWQNTGLEDDVRVRASAVGILAEMFDSNHSDDDFDAIYTLDSSTIHSIVSLALQILRLEAGPERALVRRAAALVLAMLVRGVDKAVVGGREDDKREVLSLLLMLNDKMGGGVPWDEIFSVCQWVADVDEDEIVKGHARTALEDLEALRMKSVLGTESNGNGNVTDIDGLAVGGAEMGMFGLGTDAGTGRLAKLSVTPEVGGSRRQNARPKIEEVDW